MYRKYNKAVGETLTPNAFIQVLENNEIADLPKIRKGVTVKAPKINTYPKGDNSLSKIDQNKIITVVDNILYIAKHENHQFTELKSIELYKKTVTCKSKIISLSEQKCVILYSNGGSIICYVLHIDESKNIDKISKPFVITSSTGSLEIDVVALTSNKVVIGYLEKVDKTNSNTLATRSPVFSIVNISEEDKISMLQMPMQIIETDEKGKVRPISMVYTTKLSEDEFIGTYVFKDSIYNKSIIFSTVFKIDSKENIIKYETLEYQGYYSDFEARAIKPLYLDNHRIITFEFYNMFDHNMVLREIQQDLSSGVYTFNTLCSVKPNAHYPFRVHNIDFIRLNDDRSREYVLFNQQKFSVNATNDTITLLEYFLQYLTAQVSPYRYNIIPTINLENNLLLSLDDENNFQLIKHNDFNGEILGIVKRRCSDE